MFRTHVFSQLGFLPPARFLSSPPSPFFSFHTPVSTLIPLRYLPFASFSPTSLPLISPPFLRPPPLHSLALYTFTLPRPSLHCPPFLSSPPIYTSRAKPYLRYPSSAYLLHTIYSLPAPPLSKPSISSLSLSSTPLPSIPLPAYSLPHYLATSNLPSPFQPQSLRLEIDPYDRSFVLYNIGLIHTVNGEHGRALEYYDEALQHNPALP